MGKSILVIGAGGNVGREVVRHLAARGATARAAVSRADTPRQPDVAAETVLFDFLDPDTFPAAFDGVERMFLLRPPAISNVKRDILPAIEYAAVAGVRQIAFLSLVGAEHNRFVPHAKIETVLKGSGIPWTMLRCGFFMQNLNTIHRADIVEHDDLFIPGGHGATSFIDVRDIGAAAARTLTEPGHEGRAYDLTGQETLTYGEVAAIMTQELGLADHLQQSISFFLRPEDAPARPFVELHLGHGRHLSDHAPRAGGDAGPRRGAFAGAASRHDAPIRARLRRRLRAGVVGSSLHVGHGCSLTTDDKLFPAVACRRSSVWTPLFK